MDVYLGVLEKTPEDVEEELRPQAEHIIKRRIVLEAIAKAEGLEVSDDEMREMIKNDAEALGRDPLQLIADLRESGRQEAVRDEMLLAKTVDLVADASVPVPLTEEEEAAEEEAAEAAEPDDEGPEDGPETDLGAEPERAEQVAGDNAQPVVE
jgi:trigger factor